MQVSSLIRLAEPLRESPSNPEASSSVRRPAHAGLAGGKDGMSISIMRHGEPDFPPFSQRINSHQFEEFWDLYNQSGLSSLSRPKNSLLGLFQRCEAVVASDLKRSLESATFFTEHSSMIVNPLFREVDRPYFHVPFVRLKAKSWAYLFIVFWLLGVMDGLNTFKEARIRARTCARELAKYSERFGHVLLVGHGYMNTYIRKELVKAGWSGPNLLHAEYWSYATYTRNGGG
jgi:broad specificity phosphatase PhoE